MSDIPDIINTQIISSEYDIFWTSADEVQSLHSKPVLICSRPYTDGSAEEVQLKKMLQACQLTEQDYNVIQFEPDSRIAWHYLRDSLQVRSILLLGVTPDQLGVSAQLMPHQLSRFNNCNWIVTDTLETLLQRTEIKTHLWNYGLKPAFVEKVYG